MATAAFTLFYNGVEKSLGDWGLDDLHFSDNDLAAGVVELTAAGRAVDAADLFAYGSRVIIYQNRAGAGTVWSGGTCWFDGRVEPWERSGAPGAEDCLGRLVNAWWYFERIQYKMQFTRATSATTTATYTTNRVVLGVGYSGSGSAWTTLNTGQQIAAAVNWAISQGAPVALGNLAPWAPVISDFQKCIKVSQVIQKMWQIESDFIVVWDYSTVGTNPAAPGVPTIHFLKGSQTNLNPALSAGVKAGLLLTPQTINLDAGNWLTKVKLKPRPDWIKSYVFINYDQTTSFGSNQYLSIGSDQYPAVLPTDRESKFNGVDLYYDLAGAKIAVQNQSGNITSATFDITSLAQWQKWKSELTAPTVVSAVILTASTTPATTANHPAPALVTKEVDNTGATVAYNAANAYELLDGAYCDWMADATLMPANGYPVITAQKVKATAWVYLTFSNGTKTYKQLTREFTAISYNTFNVATVLNVATQTVTSYAEPQPVGLAQIMYNAWRSLAVEGSFTTTETELGASGIQLSRANCLNFTSAAVAAHAGDGSILDWSAVNAPIRRLSGSAVKGTTTVEFGAPLHLTANALVDLVRNSRVRVTSIDLNYIFGGQLANGGGTVKHARKTHAHHAEHGADEPQVHVVTGPDALDATRTQVMTSDSSTGIVTITQQPTAGGSAYTSGIVAPEFSGAGAPGAGTLAASASYLTGNYYWDTTNSVLYRCTTSGSNSSSLWTPVGGGVGGMVQYFAITTLYLLDYVTALPILISFPSGVLTITFGSPTSIAKPNRMRPSVASELIDGLTITYSNHTDENTRTASDGTNTEFQVVFPRYTTMHILGFDSYLTTPPTGTAALTFLNSLCVIKAMKMPGAGTGLVDAIPSAILYEEITTRVWARRYAQ